MGRKIIDILNDHLEKAGLEVERGRLSDGSGAYIEISGKLTKDFKQHTIGFSFNDKGTILQQVNVYEYEYELTVSDSKMIGMV